jgi:phage terminase large subunit
LWKYKTDRLTGDPLPKLQDGNDHRWDAVRYALSPLIRGATDLSGLRSLGSDGLSRESPWKIQ